MSVYDRWHTKKPREGAAPCKEHSRGKVVLYPSADHGQGDRWQVRWRDEDGKQCKLNRPKKGGTSAEVDPDVYAEALDAKIRHELNSDSYIDPAAGRVTLEVYAKRWRAAITGDANTLRGVDERLAHIYDVEPRRAKAKENPPKSPIAGRTMSALSKQPSAVKQWIKWLEGKGLAPSYIRQIVGTLSSIFRSAIDDGLVGRNPARAESVKAPPVPPKKVVPWTLPMVEAAADELGDGNWLMAWLGAGAAMRQGEIFGFAVDDVDFLGRERMLHIRRQVGTVRVEQEDGSRRMHLVFKPPKYGKLRDVPLADELGLDIARFLETHEPAEVTLPWRVPDGKPHTAKLLFLRKDGRPNFAEGFGYRWRCARKAAGAPDTRENGMHVLRHTAASAWLAGGVDIRTVSEWMGHTDPGFTLRVYGHLMPNAAARSRAAMNAFLQGKINDGSARDVPSAEQA